MDGRNLRSRRTRAALLSACRKIMVEHRTLRPTMVLICRLARCSVRSGFAHFPTVEALCLKAIEDDKTLHALLDQVGIRAPNCERALIIGITGDIPDDEGVTPSMKKVA